MQITQELGKLAYSVREAAQVTSLSKSFIRNEIKAEKLKSIRRGNRILILTGDLSDYINQKNPGDK